MAAVGLKSLLKKEKRIGDHLPYLGHVDDFTIALKGGMLMQTILLGGFPFETAETEELNYRHVVRDTMLQSVNSSRIALYHHVVRRRTAADLASSFSDPFSQWLDRRWRNRLAAKRLFVNDLFLTIVYKPSAGKVGIIDRLSDGAGRAAGANAFEKERRFLDGVRESLVASLRAYDPRILSRYAGTGGVCSEPLEFLSLVLNGGLHPVVEPSGAACHHLPYKRLSFGIEAVEQRGADATDFAAILSMKDYPGSTTPGMLDALLRLPSEMVITQSFSFVERQTAQERIDLSLRRFRATDDDTVSLRSGLMAAKDGAASGAAAFGEHHLSVMIRAATLKALDGETAAAQSALADIGAIAVREQLNLEPAFWGQFPGNFDYVARRALISSGNCAGLCSLHGFPIGSADDNHWGQAVTVFETTSATPYYFNFHQADLGNFLLIGPSGSGKTVVLNFLTAQAQKFSPRTVFFDKDRGAEIFLRSIGGVYERLRQGEATGFNPLMMQDSAATRAFVRAFIAQLCTNGRSAPGPEELSVISDAVDANFEQPQELRRLRYFREMLSGFRRADGADLAARMARWCGAGEFAWVFDNADDSLSVEARVIGFDMTELLDLPEIRTPVMMYLFQRVEERLDGSPTMIVVDEGWKALDDEAFTTRLKDWLKTIRKRNGVVGFCTQSARDALDSRIASAIQEQTATQIFMPNARAQQKDYCEGFGLTSHELDIVRSLPDTSRCFLIKTGTDSVVARLDLSGDPEALRILSGRERTVRALDQLRAEVGDHPSRWLPLLLGVRRAQSERARLITAQKRIAQGARR